MAERSLFHDLLREQERPILRLCYRPLGNLADAQDAAQEVFLKAYRNLDSYDPRRPASPWLYQIAVNVCRDQLRRRRPEFVQAPAAFAPDPAWSAELGERRRILDQALRSLGEKERLAFVLRELEELETREVARLLESSEETVRSQISSARAKLKAYVEAYVQGKR